MRINRIITLSAIILLASLTACSSGIKPGLISPERQTIQNVQVQDVVETTKPVTYETTGTVTAETTSTVSSKLMGTVLKILVKEGDLVRKDQLLITIDDRDIQAKIRQARSSLDEARNAGQEVEKAIVAAEKGVDAARAQKQLMDATYARFQNLKEKDSVSRQEFDEVKAKWEGAKATQAQAIAMVESLAAKRKQVKNKMDQARAAVDEASSYLSYSRIHAPFAGRLVRELIDVGSMAAPGMPLLSLEKTGHFQLVAGIDESKLEFIHKDRKVKVIIPSIKFRSEDCVIEEIISAVDPMSRTIQVKIKLPQNPLVHSGLFGKAIFFTGRHQSIQVPQSAVFYKGALEGVFVIDSDSILHWRVVKTGKTEADAVEILSGLEPGEKIVTENVDLMIDGARAEVRS